MFGKNRDKTPAQDTQIPYEVYETFRQSAERRRMFVVRLIAALAVVTLLIIGSLALSRKLLGDSPADSGSQGTQQSEQSQNSGGSGSGQGGQEQPVQQETEASSSPQPSDGDSIDSTVPKPEQ